MVEESDERNEIVIKGHMILENLRPEHVRMEISSFDLVKLSVMVKGIEEARVKAGCGGPSTNDSSLEDNIGARQAAGPARLLHF